MPSETLSPGSVNWTFVAFSLLAVYIGSRVVKFLGGLRDVSYLPGLRVPFHPLGLPGAVIPTVWWNPGVFYPWLWRSHLYKRFNNDTISIVPFLTGTPSLNTANLDVIRQVAPGGPKSSFVKPEMASGTLIQWGMNLFSADGDMWRKHRRIVGPAFNNRLYQSVWVQTVAAYREMVAVEGWAEKEVVDVSVVQHLTFKLALLIIGRCGFGFNLNWSTPPRAPDGSMSVHEAIRIVTENHMISLFAPWLLYIPLPRFRKVCAARDQLMNFMREQVVQRKAEIRGHVEGARDGKQSDAFTMLVEANENESLKLQLSDQELIGNVYIMLFAGHETTAKALAATLAFLALYQDIQQEVYQQIMSVVGPTADPNYNDHSKLDKVVAVFLEALRLYPAANLMIRQASEDTVLTIPNPLGQEGTTTLPIGKGVWISCDVIGLQYNPRHFDQPEEYRPSRWYGVHCDSEAFSAFSIGARACIGRKFSTMEVVAFLTVLLRDWKVEPLFFDGDEDVEIWKQRVFEGRMVISLGVNDVPLRFIRR
ncbi:hypothetical protein AX17_002473 [Amanita inopinata Kibby_2008]|nr:hypothetical protein AX17_002473 [Amanita inopinata Kibby_2008]